MLKELREIFYGNIVQTKITRLEEVINVSQLNYKNMVLQLGAKEADRIINKSWKSSFTLLQAIVQLRNYLFADKDTKILNYLVLRAIENKIKEEKNNA